MPAAVLKRERDDLFQEIFNTYRHWSELERSIFSLAHYRGQSSESISRTLRVDVEEVSETLKACNARLHESLKDFLKSGYETSTPAAEEPGRTDSCRRDVTASDTLASRPFDLSAPRRIPA